MDMLWLGVFATLTIATCLATQDLNLDREVIRQSILSYRSKRSIWNLYDLDFSPRMKRVRRQLNFPTDDEDFDGSGEDVFDGEMASGNGEGIEPTPPDETGPDVPIVKIIEWVWYRSKVNFLDSIEYTIELQDYTTETFHSLSDKIMFGVEEYLSSVLPGYHEATPLMFTQRPNGFVDVLIDVGACSSNSPESLEKAMRDLLKSGQIGDLAVTEEDFTIREVGRDRTRAECRPASQVETTATTTSKAPTTTQPRTEPTPPDHGDGIDGDGTVVVRPTSRPFNCRGTEATCRNGQCIDRRRICDGTNDCTDGSDEPPSCGNADSGKCDPTEFLCVGTGICAQKMWRCDGDDDCGDGYDELGCPTAAPGSNCRGIEFECSSDSMCVPASYQCDGETDCRDGSDEDGCAAPIIITGPRKNVTVKEGDLVILECEAYGIPTPIVSWRLNWGNVGTPPRISMTSVNGKGELTIKQAWRIDQGAYTCEAINSKGSIFAVPDAVLTVIDAGEPDDQPPCPPGQYGMEEDSCRPCYCFGVTNECEPLKREYDEIGITFESPEDVGYIEIKPAESEGADPTPASEPINRNQIVVKPAARELQLIDLSKRFLAAAHYWSLPAQFLGAKINSYGGTLTFSFSYNNSYNFEPKPTNYSDVIIEGANGKTLVYHDKGTHPEPKSKHTRNVSLTEDGWTTPGGDVANREDMLGVLNNVDKLLLRTVYDNSMLSTGIGDVRLRVAQQSATPGGSSTGVMAYDVEKCICPEGYEGLSCQYCAAGYERITVGPFVGKCEKIITDEKVPCDVGYTGDDCSECAPGYEAYDGVCLLIGSLRCDSAGTAGLTLGTECECKRNVEGERCGTCKPGTFHLEQSNPYGCTECFCMGITRQCTGSNWYRYKVVPEYGENDRFLLTNAGSTRRLQDIVEMRRSLGRGSVRANLSLQPRDVYYWVLPAVFSGNKISAYGGHFRYTIEYDQNEGARPITRIGDVKIIGNDFTLEYRSNVHPSPGRPASYDVKLTEDYWVNTDNTPATREHLMMALADIESILVRATYSTDMLYTSVYDISLEASADRNTGGRRAVEVEYCSCPPGYEGLSCEDCAPGYYRSSDGPYLGTCVRCSCNGHSDRCDTKTGQCLDCRDNTAGDQCDRCVEGFYGDPRVGACRPCPCPMLPSRSDRIRVASCILDIDGLPTCDECPPGYEGRNCDKCSSGFEIDELRGCKKTGTSCQCDPNGSVDGTCDSDGQCDCKVSVSGLKCDVCKPSYFYFSVENTNGGCLPCFCMGVTKQCESARYIRDVVTADFNTDNFALTNARRSQRFTENIQVRSRGEVLTRQRMNNLPSDTYYWELPSQFLGNKVVSYGGELNYTVSYTPLSSGAPTSEADVIIVGNDIMLVATSGGEVEPRQMTRRTVKFREQNWRRADGQPATREHLLMALADLEYLLIRASYSTSISESTISYIFMETASGEELDGTDFAYEVEHCTCPDGYGGLSCEDCSEGYTRSAGGYYLGLCKPCQCNGHSDKCDSETGDCLECQDNTVGPSCDSCAPGFFTMSDNPIDMYCSPCACPNTEENSFSRTCEYVPETRNLLCTACEKGYEGTRCENCAEGYEGNPRNPGGKCTKKTGGSTGGIIQSPPIVTVTPSTLNVGEGKSATLRCDVKSTTIYNVTWHRTGTAAGRPIPNSAVVDNRDYTLTIPNIARNDAGTYECIAQNQVGVGVDSAVLTIARKRPKMEVKVEEPTRRSLPTGSQVTFVCTAQSEMNAYIVYWSKQGGRLPDRATDFNGILHITDLTEEDTGTYVCTGSNMYEIDDKKATLFVERDSSAVRPSVTIEPARQVIREGDEAHFRCTADGTPPISIEWRPSAGEKMPEKAEVVNGELYIPSVSMDNSAVFYCRASNPQGFAEATALLDVTAVGGPPVVTVITPEQVYAKEGENIDMRCTATGRPRPLFSWRRLGRPGLPGNAEPRGGSLQIINVQVSNRDTYVCTARNVFGEDFGTITVNVTSSTIVEKPICKTDPESLTVYVGADTSVTCVPKGDPVPTVTWARSDGRRLPPNARVIGNKLYFRNVTISNAGKYMCIATNSGGTTRSEMSITVEDKSLPKVEILPRNQQRVEIGQSASFTCRPTAGHPVEVTWSRTDRKPFTKRTSLGDGGVITFTNVTQEDGGSYVCIARNVVGFREVATLLSVIQKPTISIEPTSNVYLRRESSVLLRCNADGIPVPNVAWKKVYLFGQQIILTHYKRHSNEIRVRANDITDSATYMCIAASAAGDAQQKVTVTVGEKETVITPFASVEKTIVSGKLSTKVQLRCGASGHPTPQLEWTKKDGQLPSGSTQENGVLTIAKTTEDSAGLYVCTASNDGGISTAESTLEILVAPKLEISPPGAVIYVATGQSQVITCSGYEGSHPISYKFSKVTGQISENIVASGDVLHVISFDPNTDSGAYTCTGSNAAGTGTAEVTLLPLESPMVDVESPKITVNTGDLIKLDCVSGNKLDDLTWSKSDGTVNTTRGSQANGLLRIVNAHVTDAGKYVCTASNAAGTSTKSVTVVVQEYPTAILTVSKNPDEIRVGDTFYLSCDALGSPKPEVTITKDGLELLTVVDGMYSIDSATSFDAGKYSCIASNVAGTSTDDINIVVQEPLSLSIIPEIEVFETRSGEALAISCVVTGTDLPVTWTRQGRELPKSAVVAGNVIQIDKVSSTDGGTYICSSDPEGNTLEKSIEVKVHAYIPYFTQSPTSYLSLTGNEEFYQILRITISFRPNSGDGLLLYSFGSGGDYMSLVLIKGKVEFRYNVGSGDAVIVSRDVVQMSEWHTVTISRHGNEGQLILDKDEPVYGTSEGSFQALDLDQPLYVGGYPRDGQTLPDHLQFLGVDVGFYGCISQLIIGDNNVDMGASELIEEQVGILRCKTCGAGPEESPCQYDSVCTETHSTIKGYACACSKDFVGPECQFRKEEICGDIDACGAYGSCTPDYERELGYRCECLPGYGGPKCQNEVLEPLNNENESPSDAPAPDDLPDDTLNGGNVIPEATSFSKGSYMELGATHDNLKQFDVMLRVKVRTLDDGLILYNGGALNDRKRDISDSDIFVSLAMRNGSLEFRYNCGSGLATLSSPGTGLSVGQWHKIHANRANRKGILKVDDVVVAEGQSPKGGRRAELTGPLFIGGVNFWDRIPEQVGVTEGLEGCIERVIIDGKHTSLHAAVSSKNVESCEEPATTTEEVTESPTTAISTSTTHVEEEEDVLGPLFIDSGIPTGFSGTSAKFSGNSFISYSGETFSHDEVAEQISLHFKTKDPDGLLLLQGRSGGDFIQLGIRDARIEYMFQLGSSQVKAQGSFPLADGQWHNVTVTRRASLALMWIDDLQWPVAVQAEGDLSENMDLGDLYIGGTDDVPISTGDRYRQGFKGCIKDVKIISLDAEKSNRLGEAYFDNSEVLPLQFGPGEGRKAVKGISKCRPDKHRTAGLH
uniref:basement membrane-specific heparan sulfate proteoglycan core protein-like isoform X1 n=1 Tax=Styela clava TaxID=7725 RepID=UPI00193A7D1F|nr:basement membrane-specific heparan sulfate proteoglycan core protein-like isoform X1 [Styela clava]